VRESFDEYKKTIEMNLLDISFLYSGDVISSTNGYYEENIPNKMSSPKFIINSIDFIWECSINQMLKNTIDEVIRILDFEKLDINGLWLFDLVNSLNIQSFDPKFIFTNSTRYLGILKNNDRRPLPEYFYSVRKSKGLEIYKIPIINETDGQVDIYITDKPIQSLVYVLQNMEYRISNNIHRMNYNLYNCDYKCYKITVKSIIKVRDEKISQLLS
jgi:hypothetical protein